MCRSQDWGSLAFGIRPIISPWVLRFADQGHARNDAVIVGVIVAAMAIWARLPATQHKIAATAGTTPELARN